MTGDAITVGTVRIALVMYVAALVLRSRGSGGGAAERLLWSAGLLFYLAHVASAFHFVHAWSHRRAAVETARQTEQTFGLASGAGLWFNYAFTVVWILDVAWWWYDAAGYVGRPRWVSIAVHAFLAFMFFNGAVVFATGFSRWFGLIATLTLVCLWLRARPVGSNVPRI